MLNRWFGFFCGCSLSFSSAARRFSKNTRRASIPESLLLLLSMESGRRKDGVLGFSSSTSSSSSFAVFKYRTGKAGAAKEDPVLVAANANRRCVLATSPMRSMIFAFFRSKSVELDLAPGETRRGKEGGTVDVLSVPERVRRQTRWG